MSVETTLVPHADVNFCNFGDSDCVKGTITVSITTVSEYYDGKWTAMSNVKDRPLVFTFDTSDKSEIPAPDDVGDADRAVVLVRTLHARPRQVGTEEHLARRAEERRLALHDLRHEREADDQRLPIRRPRRRRRRRRGGAGQPGEKKG